LNLINNAIKYTEKGKITLACEIFQNDQIKISVEDTGCGIKKELKRGLITIMEDR